MKIIVQNKLIETRDICSIVNAGHGMHGFIINIINGNSILIGEKEAYEGGYRLGGINDQYRALREKVEEYWNKDKTHIPILNL